MKSRIVAALASIVIVSSMMIAPSSATGAELDAGPSHTVGTTYYVSASSGNDAHAGTCRTASRSCGPWKTLDAVNRRTFAPGDRILLKSGDTWRHQSLSFTESGSAQSPIRLGAYGAGAQPTISPSTVDSIGIRLLGVSNWSITDLAVRYAYVGISLEYADVSDRENVAISHVTVTDLDPKYNSDYGQYNHTSSGISVKTSQPASDTRSTALTNLSVTDSTFADLGAATWFGGLDVDPITGFQPNDEAQWIKNVTMDNLSVDNGTMWGFNVLFVDGGTFSDLTATNTGSAPNSYGSAGIVAAYSNNIEFDRVLVRGVSRNPAQTYDAVGFDFEGQGTNVSLNDSLIDQTDGAGIFLFDNTGNPTQDIGMSNVTVSRFGRLSGEGLLATTSRGSGLISNVRALDAYGRDTASGPLDNYRVVNLTSKTVPEDFEARMPRPLHQLTGRAAVDPGPARDTRSDSSSQVGFVFTTPADGIELTGLSRAWLPGNYRPHTLTVYRDSDKAVVASCKVSVLSPTRHDGQKACLLPEPVTLSPNTRYWVLSTEQAGGDSWGDSSTTAQGRAVTLDGAGAKQAGVFTLSAAGNFTYGPVNMLTKRAA